VTGLGVLSCVLSLAAASAATDQANWVRLFDGESLAGWTPKIVGEPLGSDERQTFRAADGILSVDYSGYRSFENRFGHLFFAKPFSRYRLRFDYRFVGEPLDDTPGWAFMNSGVMLHAEAPVTMAENQPFPISVEAQLLGYAEGWMGRKTGNVCTPGTLISVQGAAVIEHCISGTSAAREQGDWVSFEAEVRGDELLVLKIDGDVSFRADSLKTEAGDVMAGRAPDATAPLGSGYLALQSEGHPIQFRNIEILDLTPNSHAP